MPDNKWSLTDLELKEVSLVDIPANQHADVMLHKRADNSHGIRLAVGFKEEGGSEVQSVVFDSAKWTKAEATAWLKAHDMDGQEADETENTLRFRQNDPSKYKRIRMVTPGSETTKALRNGLSFDKLREQVDVALREQYQRAGDSDLGHPGAFLFIREMFKDSAIFEQDGHLWRCEYKVEDGIVQIEPRVEVEVSYRDVGKALTLEDIDSSTRSLFEKWLADTIAVAKAAKLAQVAANATSILQQSSALKERMGKLPQYGFK